MDLYKLTLRCKLYQSLILISVTVHLSACHVVNNLLAIQNACSCTYNNVCTKREELVVAGLVKWE